MKKFVIIALILAAAALFVNDLGAYVDTRRVLVEATRNAADAAAATKGSRDAGGRAAAEKALEQSVEVYLYNQDSTRVEVWARVPIEGTFIYGPARALIAGEPLDTMPLLEHYETRTAQ